MLETDLKCIERNARLIREKLSCGVKMLSVVKSDAYGHGSVQVAKMLEEKGLTDYFAVATAEEGSLLRSYGIQSDILILGYSDQEDMRLSIHHSLIPTVYSIESLMLLSSTASEKGCTAKAHLKIETGMNRLGIVPGDELRSLLEAWKKIDNVKMDGVFSHFSSADSDKAYTQMQFEAFTSALNMISEYGFKPIKHMAASSALKNFAYQLDMVRAGIALYGVGDIDGLTYAQTLKTHPVRLHWADKGEKIGYSQTFTTNRKTLVMTIPCGYGDGYPRILGNKASVLVNGKRVPVIGNVCMDMMMADVTDAGSINEKSEVILMGKQGKEEITSLELADLSKTIPYEIMLGFTNRVKRTYHT